MVTACGRLGGQRLQGCRVLPGVEHSLAILPLLVLGSALQPEAVQEGTAVQPHSLLVRAGLDRLLELADVAGDELGIELQGRAAEEDLVAPRRAADGVHRLIQRMTRRLGLAVRPQQGEQLVAAHPARAGRRDHGEQREAPPLRGGAGVQLPVLLEHEAAERVEAKHWT